MSYRRLRDPRELAALAHPLRIGILELLTVHGPMTATELGDRLDESPANCSWHLRKLAEHGFVEEAERSGGRRRPWQVTGVGLSWREGESDPEARHAGDALSRMVSERWLDRYHASMRTAGEDRPSWQAARFMTQSATWLTDEELAELREEISTVLHRYRDRLSDAQKRPEGSRLCELVAWGVPVELGEAP